jgi:hypothetical protein
MGYYRPYFEDNEMKYFKLEELIDRATFYLYGEDAWKLLNPDALDALDGIREFFNSPVTVNNWFGGGPFQYRGYRSENCPVGAKGSYHKRGMAFDLDVKGKDADEVRKIILDNQENPLLQKIQRMEANVIWVHFDTGKIPNGKKRIYLFKG